MRKCILVAISIFVFRLIDLYTTELAIVDFADQEQNLLVKVFHLDMKTFFILEIILAFLLGLCYLYYFKNRDSFNFSKSSFLNYVNFYLFNKENSNYKDWLFKMKLNKILILFGSIIPVFIITTSIVFSINNYWVYLFISGNEIAVKYYSLFNTYYFFDIVIFVFPPLFLTLLLYKKMENEFLKNKK
ncbi:hypothetical protein [Flavobacterium sp.]|uniref:hypothetical protein n=1 Tax=Flavobacterium sp. TaxID=239 RepID=UPI0040483AAB